MKVDDQQTQVTPARPKVSLRRLGLECLLAVMIFIIVLGAFLFALVKF